MFDHKDRVWILNEAKIIFLILLFDSKFINSFGGAYNC